MAGTSLIHLLRASLRGDTDLPMLAFDECLIRWAVDTGLGPMLFRATEDDAEAQTSPLWPLVKGADLTARVLTAQQIDATTELIDACQGYTPPLILLKGISLCDEQYPVPHLRPMRDVDVLIEADAVSTVEEVLSTLGYRRAWPNAATHYAKHHHGCPMVHPATGVWVEVHRGLFSSRSGLHTDSVLGPAHTWNQLRPSEFRSRPVRRLSDELQLVHLICHWADGLRAVSNAGPVGGTVAMMDIAFLLKHNPEFHWRYIIEWTGHSLAARYVHLMLTYLHGHGLIDVPPEIRDRLRPKQTLRPMTLTLAHSMIDRYVLNGRRFGRVLNERAFNRIWRTFVLGRCRPNSNNGFATHQRQADESTTPKEAMTDGSEAVISPSAYSAAAGTVYPKRRSDVRGRIVDGEVIVLDRRRDVVHQLNETARYIWDRCDGEHTASDIAGELMQAFDVDAERAATDVDAIVRRLAAVGLIEMTALATRDVHMRDIPGDRESEVTRI